MPAIARISCLVLVPLLAGCAQRTLTITSEPSAALVYLNGEEVGRTPLKYDFEFYGNYDVTLRKEGYQTLKTSRKLNAPLSGIPPFDLLGELFAARDRREWTFQMSPADPQAVDPQGMITRGQELRSELRSSKYTRAPSTMPTTRPAAEQPGPLSE